VTLTLDEQLQIRAALARARHVWLGIEETAVELGDEELDSRVAIARLAILDAADRLDQLIRETGDVDEAAA
jgi:hypothetical protein